MWTAIAGIIGLIGTVLAYWLNPARKKQAAHDRLVAQLASIVKQLDEAYRRRDDALTKNDADALTIVTADLLRLRRDRADIFQRLG